MSLQILLVGVIGYLIGSVQFARLVAGARGVDLTKTGSGVASVANLRHTIGTRWAAVATVGDCAKTLVPVGFAALLADVDWAAYLAVCVVIGHNWPVFSNFNGGRGLLATLSAATVLIPKEFAGIALVFVPIGLKMHDTAPASLAAVLLFPLVALLMGEPRSVVVAFIAIAYITVIRRVSAPPHGTLSVRTLLSKLIYDRPDARRHWALEAEDPQKLAP